MSEIIITKTVSPNNCCKYERAMCEFVMCEFATDKPGYTRRIIVNAIPEVNKNLVEVVRCKDCKYKPSWREGVKEEFRDGLDLIFPDWQNNPCPCQCRDEFYAHMPNDNWFCASGERREDASNR